jgi:CubicO group peptidase (beta-lactamase class C family)
MIGKEMKKSAINGLSIALVDDQNFLWSQGFGYANAERRIPATDQTIYGIGSIAVMQLAEQGRIEIDAPLRHYMPDFSIRSRFAVAPPITVRNLLTLPINIDGLREVALSTHDIAGRR